MPKSNFKNPGRQYTAAFFPTPATPHHHIIQPCTMPCTNPCTVRLAPHQISHPTPQTGRHLNYMILLLKVCDLCKKCSGKKHYCDIILRAAAKIKKKSIIVFKIICSKSFQFNDLFIYFESLFLGFLKKGLVLFFLNNFSRFFIFHTSLTYCVVPS